MNKWRKPGTVLGLIIAAAVIFAVGPGGSFTQKKTMTDMEAEEATAGETAAEAPALPVSEEERELLSLLYYAMKKESLTGAARILNENEEKFRVLTEETLNGERYLYYESEGESGGSTAWMEPLGAGTQETGKKEGAENNVSMKTGLVIDRFHTAFFGSFLGGRPEGSCLAVQAMVLGEPRYTYASGMWKQGKLNGEGSTGYCYYENAPESGIVKTEKTGVYKDNLLEGRFVYTTEWGSGERLNWDMEARAGVTVLSDDWAYYEDRKEYMLPSRDEKSRAYVLKEDQAEAVLWNNLIVWGE